MIYRGRIVLLGMNLEGDFVVGYGVSGRSPESRKRVARFYEEYTSRFFSGRVEIEILGEPTEEQKKNLQNIQYRAMILKALKGEGIAAVSNGLQTQDIYDNFALKGYSSVASVLSEWGRETDSLGTPRIAGFFVSRGSTYSASMGFAGKNTESEYFTLSKGKGFVVSTYGKNPFEEGKDPVIPENLNEAKEKINIPAKTSQDLAEWLFEDDFWAGKGLKVSAVGARFEGYRWSVDIINAREL